MKNNAVVVFARGKKYLKQLEIVRPNIEQYAKKCGADFFAVTDLPEGMENHNRDVYSIKLLIPTLYSQYEIVLFLDLDVYITPNCPNLFELMPEDIGLMAKTHKYDKIYKRVFKHCTGVIDKSIEDYFEDAGFCYNTNCVAEINGGVLLFRPEIIADELKKYYYSDISEGKNFDDEPPLAYYSQTNKCFKQLDVKYNCEILFLTQYDCVPAWKRNILVSRPYVIVNAAYHKIFQTRLPFFDRMVLNLLKSNETFIVHFSGNWWSKRLYRKVQAQAERVNI